MQIIGTVKSRDTKKCRLWFDARKIQYHFLDVCKKALNPREIDAIVSGRNWDDIMDKNGKIWKERQLAWKIFNPREEILSHPLLLIMPVVREGKRVVIGYNPVEWAEIAEQMKVRTQ